MTLAREIVEAYEELGLSAPAGLAEVKRAYRRLAREFHPDVNPSGARRMARINRAYQLLIEHLGGDRPLPRGCRAYEFEDFGSAPRTSTPRVPAMRRGGGCIPSPSHSNHNPSFPNQPGELLRGGWRLVGVEVRGAELTYKVVVGPGTRRLRLPLRRHRQCHTCYGSGLGPLGACPTCAGRGRITTSTPLEVELPAGLGPGESFALAANGQRLRVELVGIGEARA